MNNLVLVRLIWVENLTDKLHSSLLVWGYCNNAADIHSDTSVFEINSFQINVLHPYVRELNIFF